MMRRCTRAMWRGLSLSVLCLFASPGLAQEPAATTAEPAAAHASQPGSSQPAVAPQAYRIKLNNLLVYQVAINSSRSVQNPGMMEKIDRRELAVFDIDADGNLVLYIGAPKDTKPAGAMLTPVQPPHQMRREGHENHPATPLPPATEAKPEKPKNTEMTWTKYVLGKPESRSDDGTIAIRPEPSVAAYPVLPLPPADVKEKDKFEVTVPDIASGAGKTLQLTGQWQANGSDKINISARLEPRITPGMTPEVAFFGYDFSRSDPPAIVRINESRKPAGELPTAPVAAERPAEAPRPAAAPHHEGHASGPKPALAPKPAPSAKPAVSGPALINVSIRLDKTMPLTDDQRKAIVAMAGSGTGGDAEKTAQKVQAPSGEVQGLIDQLQGWEQGTKEQLQKTPGQ